ncbi:MAG TPA: hypothetical protein VM100_02720 [Longimicrobiales bacterium]|nr:hypothetical protein [Longimicrobiales bacterium]
MDDTDAQSGQLWPELEAIALPARERRRLPPAQRSDIIMRLCAVAPLSVKEMSELLDRSEAYIGDAIRPLVNEGLLTFLFPDQPRHPKQKYLRKSSVSPTTAAIPIDVPTPAPTPAPRHVPKVPPVLPPRAAPSPAPAPESHHEHRESKTPAKYPNAWTNLTIVLLVGYLLGRTHTAVWIVPAIITAFAIAAAHIVANSEQYARFRELQGSRESRNIRFIVLKAGVALAEIVIVYFAVNALN